MYKYLTDFEQYNKTLPIYIENPFSEEQNSMLRRVIDEKLLLLNDPNYMRVPIEQEEYRVPGSKDHPKKITHMSRILVEFVCPEDVAAAMDEYCKPLYKDPLELTHYNYIEYSPKHGNGKHAPSLSPHIDGDENILTFNYQIGGNVDDWELWIDDKPYDLKNGDAIIFSAVNQVHWRSKRKWKSGEFLEIVSFNYCPPGNYKAIGGISPIDPVINKENRVAYDTDVAKNPKTKKAWQIYNSVGIQDGISININAELED
jgi:hypothetical protein